MKCAGSYDDAGVPFVRHGAIGIKHGNADGVVFCCELDGWLLVIHALTLLGAVPLPILLSVIFGAGAEIAGIVIAASLAYK